MGAAEKYLTYINIDYRRFSCLEITQGIVPHIRSDSSEHAERRHVRKRFDSGDGPDTRSRKSKVTSKVTFNQSGSEIGISADLFAAVATCGISVGCNKDASLRGSRLSDLICALEPRTSFVSI